MNLTNAFARLRTASAERWLKLLMVASVLLPLLLLAVVAWHDYDQTVQRAGERVERTTRIGREHALKVFETNEIIVRRVLDLVGGESDAAVLQREPALHAKLKQIGEGLPQVQAIAIWNAEGRVLASNRSMPAPHEVSIADRDYFRLVQTQSDRLIVSDTLRGRIAGETFFVFARRRDDAQGRFAGIITIALSPSYFTAFYEQVASGEQGLSIELVRPDGSVVTRYPDARAAGVRVASHNPLIPLIGQADSNVVSLAASPEDGKRRYVMAQRVGRFPLLVNVSVLHSAVIEEWLHRLWLPAAVALAAGLALFAASAMTLRNTRREQASLVRLQQEAARRASAERMLSHLSQHLIRVAENEKAKLAAELHDELGGALSAIALDIGWVLERLKGREPKLSERLAQAMKLVQETAVLKRRIIDGLRPTLLQHLGLPAALRDYVDQWSKKSSIAVDLQLPSHTRPLAPDAALALFRVVQESLTNVAKYARADAVTVTLTEDDAGVAVSITDNGIGIPGETLAHPTSHGITGMQQRVAPFGGTFSVASEPGNGTRVTARIPLAGAADEAPSRSAASVDA